MRLLLLYTVLVQYNVIGSIARNNTVVLELSALWLAVRYSPPLPHRVHLPVLQYVFRLILKTHATSSTARVLYMTESLHFRTYLFHQLKLLASCGRLSWLFDRSAGALSVQSVRPPATAPSAEERSGVRFDAWRCLALLVLGVHPMRIRTGASREVRLRDLFYECSCNCSL